MIRGVPYDEEIEYLESTGTQCIILPANNYDGIDIMLEPAESSNYGNIGRRTGTRADSICFNTTSGWGFRAYSASTWTNDTNRSLRHATVHGTTATLDGVSYALANGWNTVAFANSPFALFGLFSPGTQAMYSYASCKIGACALYVGNEKVYDFIPVRVGTTGYLYDRVTRKLFGNQGTGNFERGPDKSYPVMSLHRYPSPSGGIALGKMGVGARMLLSARDYIMGGLIRQMDAIETTGYGQRVYADGTRMVNLASGVASYVTIGEYLSKSGVMMLVVKSRSNRVFNDTTSDVASAFASDRWTLEFCGVIANNMAGVYDNSSDNYGPTLCTIGYYGAKVRVGVGGVLQIIDLPAGSTMSDEHTYTLVRDGSVCTVYMDGVSIGTIEAELSGTVPNLLGFYLYKDQKMGEYRFYSRALTAAEIAHNYAIDKVRFGLPDAT